jgi:hypothetical protein
MNVYNSLVLASSYSVRQIENCIIVNMECEHELETRSIICFSFKFDRLQSNK